MTNTNLVSTTEEFLTSTNTHRAEPTTDIYRKPMLNMLLVNNRRLKFYCLKPSSIPWEFRVDHATYESIRLKKGT